MKTQAINWEKVLATQLTKELVSQNSVAKKNTNKTFLKMGKKHEEIVHQRGYTNSKKHTKRYLKSLAIREIQIKTIRYHYMLIGMVETKKL